MIVTSSGIAAIAETGRTEGPRLDCFVVGLNDLRKEGKDEKATQESRNAVEQRMRYVKNDRDRRERERDALLSRARERGYSNVW